MRKVRYRSEPLTEVNMTNLIDIVMVLLIAFILVSNFVNTGLDINLPQVRYVEAMGNEKIVIAVDPQGDITLNGEIIGEEEISARLITLKKEYPEESVFVQADETSFWGDVAEIISAAREAGFTQVNLPLELIKT